MAVGGFQIPDNPDFFLEGKGGGGGGGSRGYVPPGSNVGGGGAGQGGGGGPLGFGYDARFGFDPMAEQRRKMGLAFGRQGVSSSQLMGQQIDPQMIQRILAMLGGG